MIVDLQEISLTGIIFGIILLFLGSLLNIPELYFLGFLIFVLGVIFIVVQWVLSGGMIELLNWLPLILIFTIISALSSDLVSRTSSTQNLTWPLIGIILAVIVFFILFQGGDLDFLIPFSPVILGVGILGCIFGFVYFNGDWIRGLAYGIGALGIIILSLWVKIRRSQQLSPATGEFSSIIGENGTAITDISPNLDGKVKIGTAIWKATSDSFIQENELIHVIGAKRKQLILEVEPHKP
jgi:membrane protein implicated in regulation of membrane protease activity